jgi:hypothetical protein
MKILVVHDAKGQVKSFGVPGPQFAGQVRLVPNKGEKISEIDVPDVSGHMPLENGDQDSRAQYLLDLVEHHRVEVRDNVARLVPSQRGAATRRPAR